MPTKTIKKKTLSRFAEAVAAPDGATAADSKVQVVVCAFPGTERKMQGLWNKAIAGYPFKVITSSGQVIDDLAAVLIDQDVDDQFVFVRPNTIPTARMSWRELWIPVVYVRKNGQRSYDHSLPMQFTKESLASLFTAEDYNPDDVEKFMREASDVWTKIPVEVGYTFGNFVTPVLRGTPCEHKVIEAMIRKKYITTNEEGWKAVEHLFGE